MDLSIENLDRMSPEEERQFMERFDAMLAEEDDSAAREHLAAGQPIYYREQDTPPGHVIKKHSDGRKDLVDFSTGEERFVAPLPV
ncbi:hypothetical protein [Azospirillum sp. SYSU D00513]|uniref:hypothetical protein n=1 Tax=Azospirillum sp. SYSU D00513 TaxID=2812561 RepID=UPI001A971F07|nr:hypothetical protein [Azospirillum sp. SYSU D00513]